MIHYHTTPQATEAVSQALGEKVIRVTGVDWDTRDGFRITYAVNGWNVFQVKNLHTNESDLAEIETVKSVLAALRNN